MEKRNNQPQVGQPRSFDPFASKKLAFLLVLLAIIILFVGALSGYFLGNLLYDRKSEEYGLAFAAFFGAFFAFTLSAIGRLAMELERRERQGFLALVYIERYLNMVLPSIGRLQSQFKHMITAIEAGGWWAFALEKLPEAVEERWADISYQGTLNRVFALLMRIQEINCNTRNFNEWYDSIQEHPSPSEMPDANKREAVILSNLKRFVGEIRGLQPIVGDTEALIVRCIAEIRVIQRRRRPLMNFLARLYLGTNRIGVSGEEIEAEIVVVERERRTPKNTTEGNIMNTEDRSQQVPKQTSEQEKTIALALHGLIEGKFKDYRNSGVALSVTLISLASALIVWSYRSFLICQSSQWQRNCSLFQIILLALGVAASLFLQIAHYQGYRHEARTHFGQSVFPEANKWFTREEYAFNFAISFFIGGVICSIVLLFSI